MPSWKAQTFFQGLCLVWLHKFKQFHVNFPHYVSSTCVQHGTTCVGGWLLINNHVLEKHDAAGPSMSPLRLAFLWGALCSVCRCGCRDGESRQRSHIVLSWWCLILVRSRQERLVPLVWGGAWTSWAGREEGSSWAIADKIAKPRLIPHYPPLSCSAGWCHVVFNNCHIPLARWPPCDGWGEHEGSPRLAPVKLFHPRNAASPGKQRLQKMLLPLESTCPAKGLMGSALSSPFYTQVTSRWRCLDQIHALVSERAGNRFHTSFSCALSAGSCSFPQVQGVNRDLSWTVCATEQCQPGRPSVVLKVVGRSSTAPYFHLVTKFYCSHLLLFSMSFLVAMREHFSDSRCWACP